MTVIEAGARVIGHTKIPCSGSHRIEECKTMRTSKVSSLIFHVCYSAYLESLGKCIGKKYVHNFTFRKLGGLTSLANKPDTMHYSTLTQTFHSSSILDDL